MCTYPPPPTVFVALLAVPWSLVGAVVIAVPLGFWLFALRRRNSAGRASTGLSSVRVTGLMSLSGLALATFLVVAYLAWQAALMSWDTTQIDRLEAAGCSIPTLEAVDTLSQQQLSTANSLLVGAAIGTLVTIVFLIVFLLVWLTQRLSKRIR